MRFGALPSIENLQCFVLAAELLNFRRAAETVGLTPTAFGQRIRQIEDQLGCALFVRTTRHVEITAEGRRLLPVARDVLASAQQCTRVVHAADSAARFTLATRFELGMSWVVPAVLDLRASRPSWHIDVYVGASDDILGRLQQHQVDCVITSSPVARRDWSAEVLHDEQYVFVGAPSLLATTPLATVADARMHRLVDIDASLPLTRYLTSAGPQLEFADIWLVGSGASMLEVVLRGYGVAVLPEYMVAPHIEAGELTVLLPDFSLLNDSFRLLYRSDSPHGDTLRELAELLRQRPLT